MDANDFIEQVLKFWPSSFKPADSWRVELMTAITHLTPAQLAFGIKTLKQEKGGKKITLAIVVETCASIGFKEQSQSVHAQLRKAPSAYIVPFRTFMKAQNLWDQYLRMPMESQVMISRFYAELWGGSHGETQMIEIAVDGVDQQPWAKLERIEVEARKDQRTISPKGGWYPSWSDRSLAT